VIAPLLFLLALTGDPSLLAELAELLQIGCAPIAEA
jgi:hypothetical protein